MLIGVRMGGLTGKDSTSSLLGTATVSLDEEVSAAGGMTFVSYDALAGVADEARPLPLLEDAFTRFDSRSSLSLPEEEEGLVLLIVGVGGGTFWRAASSPAALSWFLVVQVIVAVVCEWKDRNSGEEPVLQRKSHRGHLHA